MHFSRESRIRKSSEFLRLRHAGKWLPGKHFHLQICVRAEEESVSRLGLSVSRKVGGAVVRNLVKRRFREIFRFLSPDFTEPLDVVVIARGGVDRVPFSILQQDVAHRMRDRLTKPLSE